MKERFQDLYQIIVDTLEKFNKVSKTSYDANMLELAMRQLLTLKDLVIQSVTKSFATRTYVENKVELQKLATIFNAITGTVKQVYDSRLKRLIKEKKENKYNKFGVKDMDMNFTRDLGY